MSIQKKLTLSASCLSALLLLSACGTYGNVSIKGESYTSVDEKVHDGVTTKDELRQQFGVPLNNFYTDTGHEEWQYVFKNDKEDPKNFIPVYGLLHSEIHGKKKTLTIIFNGEKVWHHTFNTSPFEKTHGVF